MNRRAVILATLALAIPHLARAETTMTEDERLLLITCAAAIISLPEVQGNEHPYSEADTEELCRMAEVKLHEPIAPVLRARLRKLYGL